MALNPTPSQDELSSRLRALERGLAELRARNLVNASGNAGAISLRGGSLETQDMVSGAQRFYTGPSHYLPHMADGSEQQVVMFYDGASHLRFSVYDPDPTSPDGYNPVVWIFDHLGNVCVTTDASGGLAEPWLPVHMTMLFTPAGGVAGNVLGGLLISSAAGNVGGVVWEGRIGKLYHPRIGVSGVFGRTTPANGNVTYSLVVGTQTFTWSDATQVNGERGPFDVSSQIGGRDLVVQLKASWTGTTDQIWVELLGTHCRQT